MLPATLAHEVRRQVLHYLEATFNMRDPRVEAALRQFFTNPEHGLFKGPWLQLRRPFRLAANRGDAFFDIQVPFSPFRHQWLAWQRLTSKGNSPKHTIVTTGTGSGKTECFLFPILDHCWREHQAGRVQGIKAIVLYPMNALASDQAGRFAEEILKSDLLSYDATADGKTRRKARLRVGLYTGRMQPGQEDRGDPEEGTYQEVQVILAAGPGGRPSYVAITNRQVMQEEPPDILLTNYKMLDYLLMRPRDNGIWRRNDAAPDLLRYLVLDELHTYDGAQGADVACLIRRLKARLAVPRGHLCVVGTSATITASADETTDDPLNRLCEFASTLFEEVVTNDAVIEEDRYRVEEITRPAGANGELPDATACLPGERETAAVYAHRIAPLFGAPAFPVEDQDLWLGMVRDRAAVSDSGTGPPLALASLGADERWGLAVGEWLRAQPLFAALLRVTQAGAVLWTDLIKRLSALEFHLQETGGFQERGQVLMALLALVAPARELRSGRVFPLVPTQIQFWIRELRRIGRVVAQAPVFSWLDEPLQESKQLPTVHCTECGESAWVALHDPDRDSVVQQKVAGYALDEDTRRIYEGWGFERHPSRRLVILSPWMEGDDPLLDDGQMQLSATRQYLAPTELVVRSGPGPCPLSGEATFPVKVSYETRQLDGNNQLIGVRRCPHCQAEDSLMFLGARAATTASVAIDEVFGSVLNNDPKLLAFTDSVQDASHRAGFFSARTYHFTFRTALQHVVDQAGDIGLPIGEAGERLLDYWSQALPGRPGSLREVLATLLPPDLSEYGPYLALRKDPSGRAPSPSLLRDLRERLNWEATSEFSLMLTHGRTMEIHAGACLGWDATAIADTLMRLRARLPGISPGLDTLSDDAFHLWILGILHRQRERGGLHHPYLDPYARENAWGKFPFGKVVPGRETYPSAGRYRPRLLVTERDRFHDYVLAPSASGQQVPWQLVWARRVLGGPAVDDASLLDLLRALLETGSEAGVFRRLHRDGAKSLYAIDAGIARLFPRGEKLACSGAGIGTGHVLFRPPGEAQRWQGAPSLSYRDYQGRYGSAPLNDREDYYRGRYRKGALRRVFAHEHTGLLTTREREDLERAFNQGGHADAPNVLTATSTLEMGIDIGDLSTTLLCSVPPSVASYLQRIGRAGRRTGTALLLTIINQRPHDLFFFSRPDDLLRGEVDPPGCWLDASAVLVRQFLAYCFDTAVHAGVLTDLPGSGKQLIDEVIVNKTGHIPSLIAWMTSNEAQLQQAFLARFANPRVVMADTVELFTTETRTERLRERIEQAAQEFNSQRLLLQNARSRLNDQKKKLDPEIDGEALAEIEREQRILSARTRKLGDISALEVLIEHGLLPNYAFPERGVRFSGTTFNQYAKAGRVGVPSAQDPGAEAPNPKGSDDGRGGVTTYDLIRPAAAAIRELAPANHFYTHSHVFEIQQLEIGSRNQPLIEEWAICGQCGHMRTVAEVRSPEAVPACPQCGYDGQGGQTDSGQHRALLPLHRSQAVSYMEYYESLSGDRGDERDSAFYRVAASFDVTVARAGGAVGNDQLPFGIEYRGAIRVREVNGGFSDQPEVVPFGADVELPEGFEVCEQCGVVVTPTVPRAKVKHRRSCSGRRQTETLQREGRTGNAYQWRQIWLYRELRSEAIRLLLPEVEAADLDTLEAAIYLGLRLRFQGNPAHLLVRLQIVPDIAAGITRRYLVLMDAVPGGTGFLKALYQETDAPGRPGEGVMDVLRRALNALETCECRRLHHTQDDTDGCYRCIRTYHMQYRAANISRERGIRLLKALIEAGEQRTLREALDEINTASLFGSVLEKRFVERLRAWVESIGGQWQETLISGGRGFRFLLTGPDRVWELELRPLLGPAQGVNTPCQPDFMLRCDDPGVRPVAIFADGFDAHVHPGESESRLADDVNKRRAILEAGQYWVWSLSWEDLADGEQETRLEFLLTPIVQRILPGQVNALKRRGVAVPSIEQATGNPWRQLQGFILSPGTEGWSALAAYAAGFSLVMLAGRGIGTEVPAMQTAFQQWRYGFSATPLGEQNQGDWCWSNRLALTEDLLVYAPADQELMASRFDRLRIALRLDDSEGQRSQVTQFRTLWRRFHALFNLFQFPERLTVFTTSEVEAGVAPELELVVAGIIPPGWQQVVDNVVSALQPLAKALALAGCVMPELEYYADDLAGDAFAELAWPTVPTPVAILTGDQRSFTEQWQNAGWMVCTDLDIVAKGRQWVIDLVPKAPDQLT